MLKLEKLSADKIRNDDRLTFVQEDKLTHQVTFSRDDYEAASALYRSEKGGSVGRPPIREVFANWIDHGRPQIDLDSDRRKRLAVEELSGMAYEDLDEDDIANWLNVWEQKGSPEPDRFLPRGVYIKYIGKRDGQKAILYVEQEDLNDYKHKNNVRKAGYDAYMAVLGDAVEGFTFEQMVHSNGAVRPTDENGHPITKAEWTQREAERSIKKMQELQASIAKAYAEQDWESLPKLFQESGIAS